MTDGSLETTSLELHQKNLLELAIKRERFFKETLIKLTRELSESIRSGDIIDFEAGLAEEALLLLSASASQFDNLRSSIKSIDQNLDMILVSLVSNLSRALYISGGLLIDSGTLRKSKTAEANKAILKQAQLYKDAIKFALNVPPSRKYGKRSGTSATASRIRSATNQWLKDRGHNGELSENAIQKLLERYPEYFPPADEWHK